MLRLTRISLTAAFVAACLPQSASAQIPALVQGRIEDAVTRAPLVGARVSSADSSVVVLTDSTGGFSIELSDRSAITLLVEQFGYVADRFDLADDAASRVTVLLLDPEPVELGGIDVEAQAALDRVLVQLENRRNVYPYAVRMFDGTDLAESSAMGSAWDFLRARLPKLYECSASVSGLCIGDRPPSLTDPAGYPGQSPFATSNAPPMGVCIDGHESVQAVQELRTLDIESVALLEIYREGREGVRVYTADYLRFVAQQGEIYIAPPHSWSQRGRMNC